MSSVIKWISNKIPALQNKSWVLMYHRIATAEIDPWDICVSPAHFEQHLIWLKNNAQILSLQDFIHQWKNRTLKKRSVALTFDDGYLDNYETAKPLLEKHKVPATFFITTQNMQTEQPFWWDELMHLFFMEETLPKQFRLQIKEKEFSFDLEEEQLLNNTLIKEIQSWKGGSLPTTKRVQLFLEVWQVFKTLKPEEQQFSLEQIKSWCIKGTAAPKIMNGQQVINLSNSPLFSIGVHTVSHPALALFSKEIQKNEIAACKETLQNLVQKPMDFLAYPYGNYNQETQDIGEEEGFDAAFTTEFIPANRCANTFRIGRKMIINRKMNIRYFNSEKN